MAPKCEEPGKENIEELFRGMIKTLLKAQRTLGIEYFDFDF